MPALAGAGIRRFVARSLWPRSTSDAGYRGEWFGVRTWEQ